MYIVQVYDNSKFRTPIPAELFDACRRVRRSSGSTRRQSSRRAATSYFSGWRAWRCSGSRSPDSFPSTEYHLLHTSLVISILYQYTSSHHFKSHAGPAARPCGRRRRQEDEQVARQHHRPAAAHRWRLLLSVELALVALHQTEKGLHSQEACVLSSLSFLF